MKKWICLLAAFLLMPILALAEMDVSSMTDDELLAIRLQINEELASRNTMPEIPEGTTIADLFPDHYMAMKVRDEVGAISTKDPVTQEDLDRVERLDVSGYSDGASELNELTGIGYLTNLDYLSVYDQPGFSDIPDEIANCVRLRRIDFRRTGIKTLPASFCNLPGLQYLDMANSALEALPDDIGNLTLLKELDISGTKVTALPASIRSLSLEKFLRDGLDLD